ncbi:MAG: metallophosphoesterase [Desulfuromonas sp.]|nr:MAG: metallophosphoesterase [Desulfuromonas sp.]
MRLFFLMFVAVYGVMHLVTLWGLMPLLRKFPLLPFVTGLWMLLMIGAPLLVRSSENAGHETLARVLAFAGFGWMGVVFIAFSFFTLVAAWELLLRFMRLFQPQLANLSLHGVAGATGVLILVVLATAYGLYEARDLRVERVRIETPRLPAGAPPLRVVQVSDIHLGLPNREGLLLPVIEQIQALQPDLLVATGDIVDAQLDHLNGLSLLWHRVDAPLGKYAVTGNHEYYAGLDQALEFLQRSGFELLRNRSVELDGRLKLVGVDDPGRGREPDERAALGERSELFTLLLKHRPEVAEASAPLFDLQLSGHSHGGQIFPFGLLTGLRYPYQNGLNLLVDGNFIYTSRGTGTWGPPLRILSPPEVTLIELIPVKS